MADPGVSQRCRHIQYQRSLVFNISTRTIIAGISQLTSRRKVADRERKGLARGRISKVLADYSDTADLSGTLPYNLRKMTPVVEVAHIRTSLAVAGIVHHFIIVHHAGNHRANVTSRDAIANVLAIAGSLATSTDRSSES